MDRVDQETRSRVMASVRSRGNRSTEQRLRALLEESKLEGWELNLTDVPGKPDVVFARHKIAIFVDGCFWHGCPQHLRMPASNQEYWTKKIERNKRRDQQVNALLQDEGWRVLRFWEHDIKENLPGVLEIITNALAEQGQ
jgi:DNA mismatch endonuclease (patch repair protein)